MNQANIGKGISNKFSVTPIKASRISSVVALADKMVSTFPLTFSHNAHHHAVWVCGCASYQISSAHERPLLASNLQSNTNPAEG